MGPDGRARSVRFSFLWGCVVRRLVSWLAAVAMCLAAGVAVAPPAAAVDMGSSWRPPSMSTGPDWGTDVARGGSVSWDDVFGAITGLLAAAFGVGNNMCEYAFDGLVYGSNNSWEWYEGPIVLVRSSYSGGCPSQPPLSGVFSWLTNWTVTGTTAAGATSSFGMSLEPGSSAGRYRIRIAAGAYRRVVAATQYTGSVNPSNVKVGFDVSFRGLHTSHSVEVKQTCSDGAGTLHVERTSSSPSLNSALSARSCASGTAVKTDVLVDGAATAGWGLADAGQAMAVCAAGGCKPAIRSGSVLCVAGSCGSWWNEPGVVMPPDTDCVWTGSSGGQVVTLSLQPADCEDAKADPWWNATGTGDSDGGTVDLGPIERLIEGVKSLLDGIRGAVDSGFEAVGAGIAGLGEAIERLIASATEPDDDPGGGDGGMGLEPAAACPGEPLDNPLNPVEWVGDSLRCAFVPHDDMGSIFAPVAAVAQGKFAPWLAPVSGTSSAFGGASSAQCSCEGFDFRFPAGVRLGGDPSTEPVTSVLVWRDFEVGNSCTGPLASLAVMSRAATGAILLLGALSVSVRFMMNSIGYVGFLSDSAAHLSALHGAVGRGGQSDGGLR